MPTKSLNRATITWRHSDTSDTDSTITLHLLLLMLSSAPVLTISILFCMAHLTMSHTNSLSSKLSCQNCSPVRQSSPLQTPCTATSWANCSQQISNLPPLHIKPSVQTLLNISLRTFVIINQSVLFAPLTRIFLSPFHPPLTSVLVLFVRPFLIFGLNTPHNPYISHIRHLQTQPKNTLLLLPSCLGHLLSVHQIYSSRFAR